MDSLESVDMTTSASIVVVDVDGVWAGIADGGSGSGDIGFLPTPVAGDLIWPGISGTFE